MKKTIIALFASIPVFTIANPIIEIKDELGTISATIKYDDRNHFDKSLFITPTLNMMIISKKLENRTYFKCYDSFELYIDGQKTNVNVELNSFGSRPYIEDVKVSEELIAKIVNQPKSYDESFSLVFSHKELVSIATANKVSVSVCGKLEEFTNDEMSAIKSAIEKGGIK